MQLDVGKNYFELFGLPVSFEVDKDALTGRYRDMQRAVHPDRFANATDRQRRLSMQQASLVNEAYRALKDPLQRSRYMLSLHDIDVHDESNIIMDNAFLMEQMELREELDEVASRQDPLATLAAYISDVDNRIHERVDKLAKLFADINGESLEQARGLSLQLQFLYRLREEAESREETFI